MNPYDFVPLDAEHEPERKKPVWHNVLIQTSNQKLYSGHLYLYMKAETPLFIQDSASSMQNPDYPGISLRDSSDEYIIPGTSLKGMLRSVVETLCNGCLTIFRIPREYQQNPVPTGFSACTDNTSLCIACRMFGMLQAGQRRPNQRETDVFLGKINIGDAHIYDDTLSLHAPIYTAILDSPKPRHLAFYLDKQGIYIAGRKFYFHHNGELRTEKDLKPIGDTGKYRNQYIQPLGIDSEFYARIDFTNLESDEFAALLLAVTLQTDMRHKIGYGKPIGLGSIQIVPTQMQLIDYTTRYTAFLSGRGITSYTIDEVADLLGEQMAPFDTEVHAALLRFRSQPSLQHLHRIWRWPADNSVVYCYPSQEWFSNHSHSRISETATLFSGD